MKSFLYWLTLSGTLRAMVFLCSVSHAREHASVNEGMLAVAVIALLLVAEVFEPLLLAGHLTRRARNCSYLNIALRGFISGTVIFTVWSMLYVISSSWTGHGIFLLVAGYFMTLVLAALGLVIGNRAQQKR